MLTIGEAIARMMPAFTRRPAETVPLEDALGRFLAAGVSATEDAPPFDNSAMDGYAVLAADVASASESDPVVLAVVGESRAGSKPGQRLARGSAMRIFTGAPLPDGADAIVVQEDTTREGERVALRFAAHAGHHVRRRAEDVASGARVLAEGAEVTPGAIALLASQRHARVSVAERPRVAILSTGDELRDVTDPPEPGTIVNSNAYALAAAVRLAGGVPHVIPRAPDDVDAIAARLEEALSNDVVLTSGGVSVGEHDLVHAALARVGVASDFWKIRIKPGKPLTFGARAGTPVVGLPGNPVSAMVTFELFVRPGLRAMLGDPAPHRTRFRVHLASAHRRAPGRPELARARLEPGADRVIAHLSTSQGSASLRSVAEADALVYLPEDRDQFEAGEELWAIPFGRAGNGATTPPFQ